MLDRCSYSFAETCGLFGGVWFAKKGFSRDFGWGGFWQLHCKQLASGFFHCLNKQVVSGCRSHPKVHASTEIVGEDNF